MSKRGRQHSGGFTLVEALVAGVILALSVGVMGLTITRGMRSMALARDFQLAAGLVDRTLTKIDTIGPAMLMIEGPTEGRFAPPNDRFTWSATIEPRLEGDLYDVTVRIVWPTSVNATRSVEVQTFLNDPATEDQSLLQWDEL